MPVYKDDNAKKNPWYFEINYSDGGKYKKKKRRGFKTKKEAEAAMTEMQNELNKGTYVEPSKMLYASFMADWLKDKQTKVQRRTLETYSGLVNNHILPVLGHIELSKLTPRQIQDLYNTLFETGRLSDENIQKVHTIINDSLNKAVGWEMVAKNVASVLDRPKARKKEMEVWEVDEAHTFLKVAEKDRYYVAFLLALTTGMRQGEILGLRWKDVNLDTGVISITQTLSHDGKEMQVGAKTDSGNRTVAIDTETIRELRKLAKRNKIEKLEAGPELFKDHGLVISTTVGTPLTPRNLMRTFYRLIENADVKKIRFHDLRHTHATMLLKANVNPKIVAERMGWADIKMIDRYAHVLPNIQKDTADAFGKVFFQSQEAK
ncbi:site-specific integrase [Brevibacillus centrosporus]|uniref:tyrosine-type recombinase/integrase n=1 Tax=Brevibacillus centrosporus TaxID=54910 RepID=UPI000F0A92C9|nr:site-specific integrase [Brevibacillus centrosporus]MEC2131922.1 site-specific integrase [Brevibacillus centrosporus]RNB64036.1 site-specific integrase [Brevibacillus centrosporus]GED34173.1 site-specific integrase [Brevibacillus centrosporus]